jgi:hypothetical protein
MGILDRMKKFFSRGEGPFEPRPDGLPAPSIGGTLELFAQQGHGKTSYLWSLLFMLRRLSSIWPEYLCWPRDESTASALSAAHEHLQRGHVPEATTPGDAIRYALLLQRMERWGRRLFDVWDRPDEVFSAQGEPAVTTQTNWMAPALWLVSLPDLDSVQGELLDLLFDEMIRKRVAAGHALSPTPFKLVVTLTKADAISDLPVALRDYLKRDRLWERIGATELAPPPAGASGGIAAAGAGASSVQYYLAALTRVHEEIQGWLARRPAGHLLIQRAAEYHVQLRFAIVSAMGSGIAAGKSGRLAWTPRRVLDPFFWAMELGSSKLP